MTSERACIVGESLAHQPMRAGREQFLRRHRLGDDALGERVADEGVDHMAIGRDAVRQRLAGDRHHLPVHLVDLGRLPDLAGLELFDVAAFGLREGIEDIGGEIGMLFQELVLDHHQVVDRVVAVALERGEPGLERVRDERLHVGRGRLDADGGGQLARRQHVAHLLAGLDRHHIGGRAIFRHVLVAGQHPGDLAEIDPVLLLQDAARPDAGGDGVAAVDADLFALEILGRGDAGLAVHQDGAVVEGAHQEHGHRGHALAMRPGADIGRDRHLADVELEPAHHPSEGGDQRIDLLEREGKRLRFDAAVLERPVVTLRAGDGFQLGPGHGGRGLHRHLGDAGPRGERLLGSVLERLIGRQHQRGRAHAMMSGIDAGRRDPLLRQRLGRAQEPVPGHDDAVVGGDQVLFGAVADRTHAFLQRGILDGDAGDAAEIPAGLLGRAVHQVVVVLVGERAIGAGHIFAVHARAVAHRLHFGRTQRTHRVEIVAPRPAILVVDRDPEVAVHRMIGARRDHGEARHHPGSDAPVVVAVLGVAARADVEPARLLHHLEVRLHVIEVVLVALGALEQRVGAQVAAMQEGDMAGIDAAFHRLQPVALLQPLGDESLVGRNDRELPFRQRRLLFQRPHIGP